MHKQLITIALFALTSVVSGDSAVCNDQCSIQGTPIATCYVADTTRTVSPWAGSAVAYPQCYNTTEYACDNTNYYLCPTGAPVVCTDPVTHGRSCNPSTYTCPDNSNSYYNQQQPATDCTPTSSTAPVVTTAPTSASTGIYVPGGSFVTPSTTCDTNLTAIPSGLAPVALGAYQVIFNVTGATINSTELTCTTVNYVNFQAQLISDLALTLNIANPNARLVFDGAYPITNNTVEVAIEILPVNTVTPSQMKFNLLHKRIQSTTTQVLTPAGIVQALENTQWGTVTNTVYAQDISSVEVLCPDTNTYTVQCQSIENAPTVYTSPSNNADASLANTSNNTDSYFQSHLYWIIPVIACLGGAVLLLLIVWAISTIISRRRAEQYAKAQEANATIFETTSDHEYLSAIPVGAAATQQTALPTQVSPSSHKPYVYVSADFEKSRERAGTDSHYLSQIGGNNDTTSQISTDNSIVFHNTEDASMYRRSSHDQTQSVSHA